MIMPRLKVLFVASECVPFAKTGGLADVVGALPIALAANGHDVRIVLPAYRATKGYLARRQAARAQESVAGGLGPERGAPRRLDAPLGVPLGTGEAWVGVLETHLDSGVPGMPGPRVYLLEHDALYDRNGLYGDSNGDFGDNLARYSLLSRGALQLCHAQGFWPDVIHAHDWQAALVPLYLNTVEWGTQLGRAASVLTIHNLGYQGWFKKDLLPVTGLGWDVFHLHCLEAYDTINLLKGGIYNATVVSTVSPRYAQEIQTPVGGEGLDGVLRERGGDVIGILNGIDDAVWDPQADPHIAAPFSADDLGGKRLCKAALQREMRLAERPDVPLIGVVSRLATQKGIDLLAGALEHLLSLDIQLVVLGSGERWAEDLFSRLAGASDRFRAFIGMNEGLAHRIEAGADLFLMPSHYEPCGLNQLYSQRYGTLPVVRAVGGLDDTVETNVTGFKFEEMSSVAFAHTVAWAVHLYKADPAYFRTMQLQAMKKNFGWAHASRQYEALYRLAISRRSGAG